MKRHESFCFPFFRKRSVFNGYRRFRPLDAARIHAATLAWLEAHLSEPFDGLTVVVTHHAPSILSIPRLLQSDRVSCAYASSLAWLIETHQPALDRKNEGIFTSLRANFLIRCVAW